MNNNWQNINILYSNMYGISTIINYNTKWYNEMLIRIDKTKDINQIRKINTKIEQYKINIDNYTKQYNEMKVDIDKLGNQIEAKN